MVSGTASPFQARGRAMPQRFGAGDPCPSRRVNCGLAPVPRRPLWALESTLFWFHSRFPEKLILYRCCTGEACRQRGLCVEETGRAMLGSALSNRKAARVGFLGYFRTRNPDCCSVRACSVLRLATQSVRLCDPWIVDRLAPLAMGILQARILEWVAMPSSTGSSQPRDPAGCPALQVDSTS